MKKVRNLAVLLLLVAFTVVLGGCRGDKDGSTESQKDNSSQETAAATESEKVTEKPQKRLPSRALNSHRQSLERLLPSRKKHPQRRKKLPKDRQQRQQQMWSRLWAVPL